MADISEQILEEHHDFRRRFAHLDILRSGTTSAAELGGSWEELAALLDRHADAEERLFYPCLLQTSEDAEDETKDAISDHNKIRDAVARAQRAPVGSEGWWEACDTARRANSEHMAEEERGALADFRRTTDAGTRHALALQWMQFNVAHRDGAGVDSHDKDPERYVSERA